MSIFLNNVVYSAYKSAFNLVTELDVFSVVLASKVNGYRHNNS